MVSCFAGSLQRVRGLVGYYWGLGVQCLVYLCYLDGAALRDHEKRELQLLLKKLISRTALCRGTGGSSKMLNAEGTDTIGA